MAGILNNIMRSLSIEGTKKKKQEQQQPHMDSINELKDGEFGHQGLTNSPASEINPPRRNSAENNLMLQYGDSIMSINSGECRLESIISRTMVTIASILRAEFICVVYRDFDKKAYWVKTSDDKSIALDPLGICTFGVGILRKCIESGQMLHIQGYDQKHVLYSKLESSIAFNSPDALCVPILADEGIVGCILCGFRSYLVTSSETEILLRLIATNTAIALSRYYDTQINNIFYQIALDRLNNEEPFAQIVSTFIDYIEKLTDAECASIYFCDHIHQEIWYVSSTQGLHDSTYAKKVVNKVAFSCVPQRLDECPSTEQNEVHDRPIDCLVCVPVLRYGTEDTKAIAVIQAMNKNYHANFTLRDENMLIRLAAEVSKTFQKRILDVRSFSLTNKQKHDYLEDGFLKEYGSGVEKTKFSMRDSREPVDSKTFSDKMYRQASTIFAMHKAISTRSVSERVHLWSLDPFLYKDEQLFELIIEIFEQCGLIKTFNIPRNILKNFIVAVRRSYHSNAFHNFQHAFSVLHLCYSIIRSGPSDILTDIDVLALLISALCHDLDHPGNTNLFEIKNKSNWALEHSFESVLEKHHSSETHRLLLRPDTDILKNLTVSDRAWVTSLLTKAILATDMALHRSQLELVQLRVAQEAHFVISSENDRRILVCFLLHCADIGAQTQDRSLALEWSKRVNDEFQNQVKREEELGLPLTDYMLGLESEIKRNKSQVGFISQFVLPLWSTLAALFPDIQDAVDQCVKNEAYYQEMYDKLTAAAAGTTTTSA